jgi:hypothetical protein
MDKPNNRVVGHLPSPTQPPPGNPGLVVPDGQGGLMPVEAPEAQPPALLLVQILEDSRRQAEQGGDA